MTERPDTVHGRLMEAVHVTGYTFERACSELEWLLEEDRWKLVGYSEIDDFMATVKFDGLKPVVERRKKIAKRLAELGAGQRATARMLGVDETTVRRDLEKRPAAQAAHDDKKPNENKVAEEPIAAQAAWFNNEKIDPAKLSKTRAKHNENRTERLEKIEEISKGNSPLITERRYPILCADPPWRYENPPIGGSNRSIENHYPTMTLEEICALPVAQVAADDALLYLWATAPKLAECFKVVESWGFEYRTNLVWVKDKIGMGYHARNQHELLLVCRRGEMPPPEPGTQSPSVIFSERAEHSEKPSEFYELIGRLYPTMGRIELFARGPREGWARWGNQAEAAA